MLLFSSVMICLSITALVNCSLYDRIHIIDVEVNHTQIIRIGNSSADFDQQFYLSTFDTRVDEPNENVSIKDCSSSKELCRNHTDGTYLTINHWNDQCVLLNYSTESLYHKTLNVEFDSQNIFVYGGPLNHGGTYLEWPLDQNDSPLFPIPYLEIMRGHFSYVGTLEPYWLFSNGYYLYVDNNVPLIMTWIKGMLTLGAHHHRPYLKPSQSTLKLSFTLCKLADARAAHEHAIKHFLGKPSTLPDIKAVMQPVWTTWLPMSIRKKPNHINQNGIVDFAKKIVENGYSGRLVIGHNWESSLGSLNPSESQFSNFKGLIEDLKTLNFTTGLRIHPYFVKIGHYYNGSMHYSNLTEQAIAYLVKTESKARFHDSTSGGAYIDSTNPDAVNWFQKRLMDLRKTYRIDSFEFDNGDYNDLVDNSSITNPVETIVKENTKLLASLESDITMNVARGSQKYGFFMSMPYPIGERSVRPTAEIPNLLHMNILGYSYVSSCVTSNSKGGPKEIEEEIFIRWVQLSVFMPSMQFSIHQAPWHYKKEVADIIKQFVDLRANYSSYIIEAMKEHVKTGAPVNPPIWWIAPNDSIALGCLAGKKAYRSFVDPACKSEFLLGDKILVAPILMERERKRDIYLPAGKWKDGNSEKIYNGPIHVKGYPADLNVLPYFLRL